MPSCAVSTCKNTTRSRSTLISSQPPAFHKFPKGDAGRKWGVLCKRADPINYQNAVICNEHFKDEDYERNLKAELLKLNYPKKLKVGVVPSLFLPNHHSNVVSTEREGRVRKRNNKKIVLQLTNSSLEPTESRRNVDIEPVARVELQPMDEQIFQTSNFSTANLSEAAFWKDKYEKERQSSNILSEEIRLLKISNNNLKLKSRTHANTLRCTLRKLNRQIAKKVRDAAEPVTDSKKRIFSKTQLKKLEGKNVQWPLEDVVKALGLMSISRKAYNLLRTSWNYPLPSERTLLRWLHKYEIMPGLLTPVLQLMKEQAVGMTEMEKLCIISFDEMSTASDVDWDRSTDTIYGPHSKAQVANVSGICFSWRQPIYFDYDTKMSRQLLLDIMEAVTSAGFIVKAIVSDLGGTNQELLKHLGIKDENTSFKFNGNDVHVFADMPHMLKLMRNHLTDTGWALPCGTVVNKSTLEEMISRDSGEIRLCPKLTLDKLNLEGAEKMKVAPAAHIFSTHTATLAAKVFPENPEISSFFQSIDDLFDIFNSRIPEDCDKEIRSGFGLKFTKQIQRLNEIRSLIGNIRCVSRGKKPVRPSLLPCQHGILRSISSLINLYHDLAANHGVTYILTRRLNQDPLESLFSVIRALGRTNDNPLPSSFNNRIKTILFGNKIKPPISSNVEFYDDHITYKTSRLFEIVSSSNLHSNLEKKGVEDEENVNLLNDNQDTGEEEDDEEPNENQLSNPEFQEDAIQYFAGYIAFAIKRKYNMILGEITRRAALNCSEDNSNNWIFKLSRGGLMVADASLLSDIKLCESTFNRRFQFPNLVRRPKITSVVCQLLHEEHPHIDERIIAEFVKVRIKIRIKYVNSERKSLQKQKRLASSNRKNTKKKKQFVKSAK